MCLAPLFCGSVSSENPGMERNTSPVSHRTVQVQAPLEMYGTERALSVSCFLITPSLCRSLTDPCGITCPAQENSYAVPIKPGEFPISLKILFPLKDDYHSH